jgi:hypothetical protein
MGRIHQRNFGLPSRAQAVARWSVLEKLGKAIVTGIATVPCCVLLIGLVLAVLCWWLLRRTLALMVRRPSLRFLLAARERLVHSKFAAIWVWSILVGVNIVVTFVLAWSGVRSREPFGLDAVWPTYLAAMIASFVAWFYVVRSLRLIIAPDFAYDSSVTAIRRLSVAALVAIGLVLLLTAVDFALSSFLVG